MNKVFYVTTPIYYVNDKPHIGHAYTSVAADILARVHRLRGYRVKFLTGTDEHGQKVESSAKKNGCSPIEYCDQMSQTFCNLTDILNISNDDFIRTTEARHKHAVQEIWNKMLQSGDIYKGIYKGWYNISDEAFVPDNEVLDGGFSKDGKKLEFFEESSYFFKLSKWQQPLLDFFESHKDFVRPQSKFNEVISFVKSGLKDLSISRSSFSWGIKVPNDNEHIIYVWIDALTNYLSAIGYGGNIDNELWNNSLHIIGKDILKFHAVYWPCMLMSVGINPPKNIFAHGWWTNNGQKISKSLGNTIDPIETINKYGLDQFRYFMLREVPFGNDGDFSEQALVRRINADLCNNLGNLIQRVLKLAVKNIGNHIECSDAFNEQDAKFINNYKNMLKVSDEFIFNNSISKALDTIFEIITEANQFVELNKPWDLAKTSPDRFKTVISILLDSFRYIGFALYPFIPNSMRKLYDMLGMKDFSLSALSTPLKSYDISEITILFNKVEE